MIFATVYVYTNPGMIELVSVVLTIILIAALSLWAFPSKEDFVQPSEGGSDYVKAIESVRYKFNDVYGTLKQVYINQSDVTKIRAEMVALRKQFDDMFVSTSAKFGDIQTKYMSKLDRIQFDDDGKMLVCDVDGSSCETLHFSSASQNE